MWKAYLKLDQKILGVLQDAYLWLLDRTGIYVASTAFLTYAGIAVLEVSGHGSLWVWGPLLALVGLSLGPNYLMQDRAENERFNLIAMLMEGTKWRHVWNIFILQVAVFAIITLDVRFFFVQVGFLIYGYLLLIKIRDRDKKPFLKPAEGHDLAVQHGSD